MWDPFPVPFLTTVPNPRVLSREPRVHVTTRPPSHSTPGPLGSGPPQNRTLNVCVCRVRWIRVGVPSRLLLTDLTLVEGHSRGVCLSSYRDGQETIVSGGKEVVHSFSPNKDPYYDLSLVSDGETFTDPEDTILSFGTLCS